MGRSVRQGGYAMRNDLDHLPADKQRELARVVQIIFE
ncbi:nucleotidyltransferase, partial [Sphingobium yanoikuyae]|nr:nucleotidyltransferase [Sphingobium yanoikuyae]